MRISQPHGSRICDVMAILRVRGGANLTATPTTQRPSYAPSTNPWRALVLLVEHRSTSTYFVVLTIPHLLSPLTWTWHPPAAALAVAHPASKRIPAHVLCLCFSSLSHSIACSGISHRSTHTFDAVHWPIYAVMLPWRSEDAVRRIDTCHPLPALQLSAGRTSSMPWGSSIHPWLFPVPTFVQ